jgi:hypothetical protein
MSEIVGTSVSGIAVSGESQTGQGIRGVSLNGPGVAGKGTPAGLFEGLLDVSGKVRAAEVEAVGSVRATDMIAQRNISALGNVNAGVEGIVNTKHVIAQGNISAVGNVNAGKTVNAFDVVAQGNISALGNVNAGVNGTVSARHVSAQGNISALGNMNAKNLHVTEDITLENADCAEEFDLEVTSTQPAPGTVMVLGSEGSVCVAHSAYDKRVAGVVAGGGEYRPGIILGRKSTNETRIPIALMGKVFCNVDATFAPVAVGDLLTTSATPGHAMKASDSMRAFGAVIGKALRPLSEGQGLIPVLVALQ